MSLTISRRESLTFIGESEPISIGGARSRTGKFPLLTHLTIEYCKKLETLHDQLLNLPAIQSIDLTACESLSLPTERFGNFRSLKKLDLSSCNGLQWERGMVLPSSLRKLSLWNCGDFSALFPKCLENLTSLEYLVIGFCRRIVSIPAHLWTSNLASLQALRIECCPDLESIGGKKALANIKVNTDSRLRKFEGTKAADKERQLEPLALLKDPMVGEMELQGLDLGDRRFICFPMMTYRLVSVCSSCWCERKT